MAFFDTTWYVSSVAYAAITARPQNTAVAAGVVRRQFTAPAVNSERCFVAIVAGTTANVTDATWVLTRGAKTTDGTVTWQECTGQPAVNGDVSSTPLSSAVRSLAVTLGQIVKNNAATHYFICSTAGTPGASEPSYNTTAGATTADGTCTWTSLGAVGSFTAWGAPHARLANAYAATWGAAGNKFWIADNHAETQSTNNLLTNPATAVGGATYTVCVDRTAALPPTASSYKTGATISTTGSTTITFQATGAGVGTAYYEGIAFNAGDGGSSSNLLFLGAGINHVCKNCAFAIPTTSASSSMGFGGATSVPTQVLLSNCTVQFGHVSQTMKFFNVNFEWRDAPSAIQGATFPTVLFSQQTNGASSLVCRGVDFSAFPNTLVGANVAPPVVFEDCKFHASVTRLSAAVSVGYAANPVVAVRCGSSAADNIQATRDEYAGTQSVDTAITRVGGGTDGIIPVSHRIVANAQATFFTPYRMLQLSKDNDRVNEDVTVTVYGVVNGVALPKNDELWMELQYLGSASSPLATFKSTGKSHPLAAGASVASDSSVWNGTGFATWDAFSSAGGVIFSGGNLVVTNTGTTSADQGARVASTAGQTSGKYYFEVTWTTIVGAVTTSNLGVGIGTTASTFTAIGGTATTGVMTYRLQTVYSNNVMLQGATTSFNNGQTCGVAVDLDNRKIWFRPSSTGIWNYVGSNNPATNVGGFTIPAGTMVPYVTFGGTSGTANNVFTANFGASSFIGAVPSGFTPGWPSVWTPFKLVAALISPQPQLPGYIYANVRAAKPSEIYYVDPKPELS